MAQWIPNLRARLSNPTDRALLLELLAQTEREPATLGATAHLLVVAQ